MSNPELTTARLNEILAVCEAATPGPWTSPTNRQPWPDSASDINAVKCGDGYNQSLLHRNWKEVCANIDFLTRARTALPEVIRELIARNEEVAELRKQDAQSRATGCWRDEQGHPCKGCELKAELIAEREAAAKWAGSILSAVRDNYAPGTVTEVNAAAKIREIRTAAIGYGRSAAQVEIEELQAQLTTANEARADLNEVLADKRRLARELDVALNGEEGAARQASLCDLVPQANKLREAREAAEAHHRLWVQVFGTSQLTHARARLESAESKVQSLTTALAAAEREIGVVKLSESLTAAQLEAAQRQIDDLRTALAAKEAECRRLKDGQNFDLVTAKNSQGMS